MHLTKPTCISGLTSTSMKLSTPGPLSVYVKTTDVPPSGIVITISQSGGTTASFTSPTTSEKQRKIDFNAKFNCAIGDVITVALTSSAVIDQPPNLIKSIITVKQGG